MGPSWLLTFETTIMKYLDVFNFLEEKSLL